MHLKQKHLKHQEEEEQKQEHKDGKSTAFKQSLRILDLRHFRVHRGRIKKAEIRFITLNINCEFYKIYNLRSAKCKNLHM